MKLQKITSCLLLLMLGTIAFANLHNLRNDPIASLLGVRFNTEHEKEAYIGLVEMAAQDIKLAIKDGYIVVNVWGEFHSKCEAKVNKNLIKWFNEIGVMPAAGVALKLIPLLDEMFLKAKSCANKKKILMLIATCKCIVWPIVWQLSDGDLYLKKTCRNSKQQFSSKFEIIKDIYNWLKRQKKYRFDDKPNTIKKFLSCLPIKKISMRSAN